MKAKLGFRLMLQFLSVQCNMNICVLLDRGDGLCWGQIIQVESREVDFTLRSSSQLRTNPQLAA